VKEYLVAGSVTGLLRRGEVALPKRVYARTIQQAAIEVYLSWGEHDGEGVVYVQPVLGVRKITRVHLEQVSRWETRAGKETFSQTVSVLRVKGLGPKSEVRILRTEAESCGEHL